MKIRNGFVSNSSSSSYLMVGFRTDKTGRMIVYKLGLSDMGNDWEERENVYKEAGFKDYGYGTRVSKNGVIIVENYDGVECVGIDAEKLLNEDKTVTEIGQILIEKLQELNSDIEADPEDAVVLYGESSSEW